VKDKVGDVHFYFGQLDQLVRIVLFQLWKQQVPAAARSGENCLDIRRDAQLRAMPSMPELTAGAFLRGSAAIFLRHGGSDDGGLLELEEFIPSLVLSSSTSFLSLSISSTASWINVMTGGGVCRRTSSVK